MKKVLAYFFVSIVLSLSTAFSSKAQDYDIESIKVEQDGSITVRVWGNGRNRVDAKELAKKNAVYDVIFKGITKGVAKGIYTRPILPVVNAREKYQEYFDIFFMDGGEYLKYVSMEDRRLGSNEKYTGKIQVKFCTTVRVLVPELKARLKADNVLKSNFD